jgi:hypothetical protein
MLHQGIIHLSEGCWGCRMRTVYQGQHMLLLPRLVPARALPCWCCCSDTAAGSCKEWGACA